VIVTFLALLELMKLNQFIVRQNDLLGEIVIERRDNQYSASVDLTEVGKIDE
jgi:chromatin segregation and condensation protein Rec8/ScpA/Scc1 (kleisin family)